jgi:Ulp1 family protease
MGRALKSAKVIVGYMNLNQNHWIAAKIDLTQNSAAIADSLHASYQQEHPAVFAKLQNMANLCGHKQELQRFTVEVPDQRNTNDCGVFACLFQLYMAQTVRA